MFKVNDFDLYQLLGSCLLSGSKVGKQSAMVIFGKNHFPRKFIPFLIGNSHSTHWSINHIPSINIRKIPCDLFSILYFHLVSEISGSNKIIILQVKDIPIMAFPILQTNDDGYMPLLGEGIENIQMCLGKISVVKLTSAHSNILGHSCRNKSNESFTIFLMKLFLEKMLPWKTFLARMNFT